MQSERQLVPTRTLILHGFKDAAEYEKFKDTLVPKDTVHETYTIPKTNFLFIMFYNLKDSMKFKKLFSDDLSGAIENYSHIKVKYTISKYEIPKRSEECNVDNKQSTVNFTFKDMEMNIEDTFIVNFLKQYGEVKEIKISKPQQKTVEFYDFRSAKKAYDTLNESVFGTGTVLCKWMWDLSIQHRAEYLKQTDELLRMLTSPVPVHSEDSLPPSKKIKTVESLNHPFVSLFDDFIAENISNIERILKPK